MYSKINCKVIIIVFHLICFGIYGQSTTTKEKTNYKKEETTKTTSKGSAKPDAINKKDHKTKEKEVTQKKLDSLVNVLVAIQNAKNDSILKYTKMNAQESQQLIRLINQQGDSIQKINKAEFAVVKKKVNQIFLQTQPEKWYKKFIDNWMSQWLYDTIFGNSDKTGFSLLGTILTFISLLFQLGVMIIRSYKCFMKINSEPKRIWCWIFGLNWVFLVASFFAGSYQSLKHDERYTAQMHQEVTSLLNDHSNFFVELKNETQKTSLMLSTLAERTKNMSTLNVATLRAELRNNQKQAARQQKIQWNAQMQIISNENAHLKEQLINEIESNSTSVFWFILLLVAVFFKEEIASKIAVWVSKLPS